MDALTMTRVAAVARHHDGVLAGGHVWTLGGESERVAADAEAELATTLARPSVIGGRALYLGSGTAPSDVLARHGFDVTAVDVRTNADFQEWLQRDGARYDLIVCLGDTLSELPSAAAVEGFVGDCAARLLVGGRLLVSFRDHSGAAPGDARASLVQQSADRIVVRTEYVEKDTVLLHDVICTRAGGAWRMHGESHRRQRIAPLWLAALAGQHGLRVASDRAEGGTRVMELVRWSSAVTPRV